MNNKIHNKYYLYLHKGQKQIPWNIPDPHPLNRVDFTYFGKVFEAMEKKLNSGDLIFYFTWDCVDELPSYGENVVVVIVGEEWCRIPTYIDKVKAIFQCFAIRPLLGCNPFVKPSYLNFVTLIQFLRIHGVRLPYTFNYLFAKIKTIQSEKVRIAPVFPIPIGYGSSLELPVKEISKRKYDIFFAGSIKHKNYSIWSIKNWLGNPKLISRNQMLSSLELLKNKYLDIEVEMAITSSFGKSAYDSEEEYHKKLMDTKICLVPRGTSWETLRFFEGLKYGCILITEALPQHWFYENAPMIQISNWSELETIVPKLLNDKLLMQKKHQESLNWWKTKCSEVVIGKYMAEQLNSLN